MKKKILKNITAIIFITIIMCSSVFALVRQLDVIKEVDLKATVENYGSEMINGLKHDYQHIVFQYTNVERGFWGEIIYEVTTSDGVTKQYSSLHPFAKGNGKIYTYYKILQNIFDGNKIKKHIKVTNIKVLKVYQR